MREFRAATDALLTVEREIGKPAHMIDAGEQWHAIQAAGQAFEAAQRRFIPAAVDAAGAQLR